MSYNDGPPDVPNDFDGIGRPSTAVHGSMGPGTTMEPLEPNLLVEDVPYGAPHPDSGYKTRRSDASPTADVPERDQECQSLQDHISDYLPLINFCLWPGCKSNQNFLTSNDLDFHFHTDHLRQCPLSTCNTRRPFRRRSDLLRHMESVHSGARRFICDYLGCQKAYSRKDKLTAHKKSHIQGTCGKLRDEQYPRLTDLYRQTPLAFTVLEDMNSYPLPPSSSNIDIASHGT